MRRSVGRALLIVAVAAVASGIGRAAQLPDGVALADFDRRVKECVALRDELNNGAAKLSETAKPEEITAAEQAMAARIRAARHSAKRGDIFTPAIAARFRVLLNPELRGTDGKNTRGAIYDEGPGPDAFPFKVNDLYPKTQPLGTVPPNILQTLPPLPDNVEYRFVGRHLILRDTRCGLIVDYIFNVLPAVVR